MKKIYIYLLKSYIGPFVLTFFIALFVLLMQFLWKYIDDLVGKGLEWHVILQLLFYASTTFVPLAMPLAVLLSSLMLFGNLGETYELVAMKASGISVRKIMTPLFVFALFLSIIAFYFSNSLLPIANLKTKTLLFDVRQQKPALSIEEGVFYKDIDNYVIRVAKKEKDNQTIRDVIIYDHSRKMGNTNVTRAEWGKMVMTDDKKYLIFTLYNGFVADENPSRGINNLIRPITVMKFSELFKKIDLISFSKEKTNETFFKDNEQMLNVGQLKYSIDSLKINISKERENFAKNQKNNFYYLTNHYNYKKVSKDTISNDEVTKNINQQEFKKIKEFAIQNARSQKENISFNLKNIENSKKKIWRFEIELNRKFSLSLACFILFIIGASMGVIIRKGGIGFPMVFSVMIFIIFWIVNITGEKFAREGLISAYLGMWLADLILLPFGFYLLWKSTTDSQLLDAEAYQKWFNNLRKMKFFRKNK